MSDFDKDINVPTNDTISRQAAIDAFDGTKVDEEDCTEYDIGYNDGIDFAVSKLSVLPSAPPEPISEEYARAVRTWLMDYQIRSAKLQGRYTPYEVLGWVVNDWEKENE